MLGDFTESQFVFKSLGFIRAAPLNFMKILSWSCRGLGNPGTIRAFRKLLISERPLVVFLMETKLKNCQMNLLNTLHFHVERCLPVNCVGDNRCRRGAFVCFGIIRLNWM